MALFKKNLSQLNLEERRIEQLRAEILRRQQELENRLVRIPSVIERKKQEQKRLARERSLRSTTPISYHRSRSAPSRKVHLHLTPPSRIAKAAKIRFFLLLSLFVFITYLVWKAIPSN